MNDCKGIFLLVMSIAMNGAAASQDCAAPGITTLESVVRISDSTGVRASAVVVGPGLVLTAAHVVDPQADTRISGIRGRWRDATLAAIDVGNDLALLFADTSGIAALTISEGGLQSRESVWAAGYPRNGDLTISEGRYLSVRNGRVQTDAYIDSGQSGGALLKCYGSGYTLAGIVHGYLALKDGESLRNTGDSLMVTASTVRQFMRASRTLASAR